MISVFGVVLAMGCLPANAQNPQEPRLWSVDITPQVGYRTSISLIAVPAIEGGVAPRVAVDSSPDYGVAFGVRYNDEDVVEFRWARQETRMHFGGAVIVPSRVSVVLDQFHLDCSHEYVLNEWPQWARPFVIGSVGVTHVSSTAGAASFTRFSFGIGGGIKVFPARQVGFKMQAQWLPLWVNPEVQAICGFGCVIQLKGQLASQGEVTFGPVFRF